MQFCQLLQVVVKELPFKLSNWVNENILVEVSVQFVSYIQRQYINHESSSVVLFEGGALSFEAGKIVPLEMWVEPCNKRLVSAIEVNF